MKKWVGPLLVTFWATTLLAQQSPLTSRDDVAAGARLFRTNCAVCHGRNGEGGRGPNLAEGKFRHGSSDAALLRTIMTGIPGTEMPGLFYSGERLWQIIAFLRWLGRRTSPALLPGDPGRGERLFQGKGGCTQCHMLNGEGGRLGPALSDIGALRSPEQLRTSIVKPNAEVNSRYWPVQVSGQGGQSISGVRMNEDTYSIQVMDMRENLHSFWKRDLREVKLKKTSLMPGYEAMFSRSELDDLVAYLSSLRGKARFE